VETPRQPQRQYTALLYLLLLDLPLPFSFPNCMSQI
jgi:hypothetical protein